MNPSCAPGSAPADPPAATKRLLAIPVAVAVLLGAAAGSGRSGEATELPFQMGEEIALDPVEVGSYTFHAIRFRDGGEVKLPTRTVQDGTVRSGQEHSRIVKISLRGTCGEGRKGKVTAHVVFLDGYGNPLAEVERSARPSGKGTCRLRLSQLVLPRDKLRRIDTFRVRFGIKRRE